MQGPLLGQARNQATYPSAFIAGCAVLAVLIVVQLNLWIWHPGIRSMDELGEYSRIQVGDEGQWPTLYFGGHGLTALSHLALLHLIGPWALEARLLSAGALILEACLLFLISRRYWGDLAGLGAVLALCANAYTLARTRTLYSFQFVPAIVLSLVYLQAWARRPWQALAWGLAAGLCIADYEALILIFPALAWLWSSRPKDERAPLPWMLGGLSLGIGIVAWQTLPLLASYWGQRSHEAAATQGYALIKNMSQILGGGMNEDWLLGRPATWPLWLWPWLVIGLVRCWRSQRWILVLIVTGLLPMAIYSGRTETNRALVAWPGLLLACGAGGASFAEWLHAKTGRAGLGLALAIPLFFGFFQFKAYQAEAGRMDFDAYEYSRRLAAARDFLRARRDQGALHLLLDLNYRDVGEARYFFRGLDSPQGSETWVLFFEEQLPPGPRPAWGDWREFRAGPDGRSLLLLRPLPGTEQRFERAQTEVLTALGPILKVVERTKSTTAYLLSDRPKDPLAASIVLDGYLRAQELLWWKDPAWPATFEKLQPQTTRQRLWMAMVWEKRDPVKALTYFQEALRLDPERVSAQRALADFLVRHPSLAERGPR